MCIGGQVFVESRGVRFPGAGVVGGYKPPDMGAGKQLAFTIVELFLQHPHFNF